MSLQKSIDEVKMIFPLWKSKSRIIGRAGEIYCYKNMKCIKCNASDWKECTINEKSKDQICKKCNKKYQIKCKNISKNYYNKLKKTLKFKTIGAEYNSTLNSIKEKIDYIIILYEKENNNIIDIIHIKSNNISENNIIPRKPLGKTAKRAGWQGCYLIFEHINFIK